MGFGETNNILGLRAQITANLAIVVKNSPIKILTIKVEGGFQAIVLDSKNDSVAITEAYKDPARYKQDETVTDALGHLLQLSSKMALDKLRSDGNILVMPRELKVEGFFSDPGLFSGGPSGVDNNGASFGTIINGRSFGSSTKEGQSGGAATDSGHCGKRTIGGCGCGCLCGCGCSKRPPGIDQSEGTPGGDKLTCTFPNAGGNIFDDDGSGDGFEERLRRRMEMLGNNPAPFGNSNATGGLFGDAYKRSTPGALFESSQPSTADDDVEENGDFKRARTVAEALPTRFGGGLNRPPSDSTLSSGFGSSGSRPTSNSLPSFSDAWRTSSFGKPTVNASVTQPSQFGTCGSGLSENVPSVNMFGDGISSRTSGDAQKSQSSPSATFGSMPSFSSAAGSNHTGFGGRPIPSASTNTRSAEKPVNLDRTREVFGNPATYSSGFGGGFGSSVLSSSIKGSTVDGSPFAQPSASGDFGSSARLAQLPASGGFGSSAGNGPFDRYTAKHSDTERRSSSNEEWEVESDLC